MLAPGLATMLVVITTDAVVDRSSLGDQLAQACSVSFERVDSDGCMSTNDTVLLLSSGASGVARRPRTSRRRWRASASISPCSCSPTRRAPAHTIAIEVRAGGERADAVEVGRAIARSNLFKCAIFGRDPNWGRVLSAIGTTAADFEPDRLDVAFNGVQVCRGGGIGEPRDAGRPDRPREVRIEVDLHAGSARRPCGPTT